jgi:dihydrofolate reductase
MSRLGAVVGGRWTYEAADHWGDENPWGVPFFIVTHRPEEEPEGGAFTFVSGVREAIERARDAAGAKDVHVMGGADIIRQALDEGLVDELTIVVAPVVLGGGKRLFEGFDRSLELEHLGVRQSANATFVDYRVKP